MLPDAPQITLWATAFALAQLVKAPLYVRGLPLTRCRRFVVALLATAFTHPIVWFVLPEPLVGLLGYWGYVLAGACFAIAVESGWFALHRVAIGRAASLALAANGLSLLTWYAIGPLIA